MLVLRPAIVDQWGLIESSGRSLEYMQMLKNTVRGILGLVLTAAATWLAGYIVEQIFGADEEQA
jgi:hypothetical protein